MTPFDRPSIPKMALLEPFSTLGFSTEEFNRISTLGEANRALQRAQKSWPTLLMCLRDILVEHSLNDKFGYSLLHRHFPLKQQHILVELDGVTTLWKVSQAQLAEIHADGVCLYETGAIHPTSWMLVRQGNGTMTLMPFEFAYVNGTYLDTISLGERRYEAFLQSFLYVLEQANLQGAIALTLMPDVEIDGAIEKTIGEANILRVRGEHNVASRKYPSGCEHEIEIQASFFWPTGADGQVPVKAKGS